MKKLFVVADWVRDPLYFPQFYTSVEGRLKNPTPRPTIIPVAVSPNAFEASYITRQIVETEKRYGRPEETLILIEADSHNHVTDRQDTAASAPFYIVRLASGMHVMGTNRGSTFSLLKDHIAEVFTYEGIDSAVAFGARDEYSRMCAYLMEYMEDELEFDEVHTNLIPEVSGHRIGHVDTFGNLFTTLTVESIKGVAEHKEEVVVAIGSHRLHATYLPHPFQAHPGTLVLSPSASGAPGNAYLQLTVWNRNQHDSTHTAAALFHHPLPGEEIIVGT